MGVSGLLTYCLEHKAQCCDEFDLVEEARFRGLIEILVDYYAFQLLILHKFLRGLSVLRGNPFLRIIGAEYATLDTFITKLISDLKSLGIKLVFFVDGAKGSSSAADQKLHTWINRFVQDVKGCTDLLDTCRDMRNILDVPESSTCRPVLLEPQIFQTLKRCECEVVHCPSGEADFIIARAFHQREAFAVLSNDSDFCIFKDCRFIPFDLFDLKDDLQLGQPSLLPEKPLRLRAAAISSERVQELMGFPEHDRLIELSIVGGNDFTKEYMRGPRGKCDLIHQLGIQGRVTMAAIVDWVNIYGYVQNHQVLRDFMHKNPGFKRAVEHSRKFYSLTEVVDQPINKGPVTNIISDGISTGLFSANVMSMHCNIYWHRLVLEDDTAGFQGVEIALAELRSYIYRIVLTPRENTVKEYGKHPETRRLVPVMTFAVDHSFNIPSITYIKKDKVFQNLRFFHQILTHQEPGRQMNYFDRYGRKIGFICYLLRYFLTLNWDRNLYITQDEFLALVALVFSKPCENDYQQFSLLPTVRCVTIANWFQDVYRHAYLFLGHLLYLSHEFPEPKEIFSGSAWIAFHTCKEGEAWNRAMQRFRQQDFQHVQQQINKVIKEKRHIIAHIVEDVFVPRFNTR